MAVLTGEFLCPQCQAKLRINERGKKSAQIVCPECNDPIQVKLSSTGNLVAFLPGEKNAPSSQEDLPLWSQKKPDHFALLLGGIAVIGLMLLGLWWGFSSNNSPLAKTDSAEEKKGINNSPERKEKNDSPPGSDPESQNKKEIQEDSPFAQNLKLLGQQVDVYQHQNGHFPPALWMTQEKTTSNDGRFSWLAGLDPALSEDRSLLPQWNLSWRDPLNDRFVRRRRKELLNPAIRLQASPDRYPASHIVGIAGVGHDAPGLAASDPRAGIFGINRSTKVKDVTDGLSNTMLAAGVTGKLSSWADGTASFRPVVLEPYINGPDGFGSGQKNGMFVLMADGSVRFLNKKTEPTIIRRMAAIADALPLDASVPGEPGTKSIIIATNTKSNTTEKMNPKKEEPPLTPTDKKTPLNTPKPKVKVKKAPKIEPVPPIDFEKALSRKVLQFELTQPAPLETVLIELEAMMGVRIEFDQKQIPTDDAIRQFKVSFSKRNVSFKELLIELIKPAGLRFEIRKEFIAILKKQ